LAQDNSRVLVLTLKDCVCAVTAFHSYPFHLHIMPGKLSVPLFVGAVGQLVLVCAAFTGLSSTPAKVTEAEVQDAQGAWGDAIVDIGRVELAGGDFETRAEQFVDALYAFDITDVLFKPTMAEDLPFRTTREGTLSYFIANAPAHFPEDVTHGGFARKHWQAVRFEVAGSWYGPGAALSMGHYIFTDMKGVGHVAEFSFAYVRDDEGKLRLVLHHSSFPFCGEEYVTANQCMLSSSAGLAAEMQNPPFATQQRRLQTITQTPSAVLEAERIWGNRVVDLGRASAADVHDEATDFVAHSYAYSTETPYIPPMQWTGPGTLFKPTKARVTPFRTTLAGGVSYFVGGNANFAEDHGFALQPWTKVRFEAAGTTQVSDSLSVTMGHYYFTDVDGNEHRAEFSLAFVSTGVEASIPLIALHHSSFPFCSTCSSDRGTAKHSGFNWVPWVVGIIMVSLILCIGIRYKKNKVADSREAAEAFIPKDSAF